MAKAKKPQGFATLSAERRREIARLGGQSVKPENRSFSKDPDVAREAGRKGGAAIDPKKRTFSRNPALASAAGKKGGLAGRRVPKVKG